MSRIQTTTDKIDILIIDDDKISQKIIIRALTDEFKTHTAGDGESGITMALELIPDLILLDVEMPGLNGYEVCDRLRNNEATRKIPIIFMPSMHCRCKLKCWPIHSSKSNRLF